MGADGFIIKASLNQALFGFGDAVCVPVVEWIARNYLNLVWEEEFTPVMPNQRRAEPVTYRKIARK
jgi:DNA (cytosine-5)-methyltransferase 1